VPAAHACSPAPGFAIALLRGKLGCTLPIEVWHLGPDEMGPAMRSLLEDLGAQAIDALEVAKRHQVQCLGGWELKSYALMHSRFSEVLFLDADNVPVKDPSCLFERPEFQETGAIFWPDIARQGRCACWILTMTRYGRASEWRDSPQPQAMPK
jgi:hypothetical protein